MVELTEEQVQQIMFGSMIWIFQNFDEMDIPSAYIEALRKPKPTTKHTHNNKEVNQ